MSSDLISSFHRDMQLRGMTFHSIQTYLSALGTFQTWLGKRDLRSVGKDELRAYVGHMRDRSLAYRTMRSQFTVLSTFYEYLEGEGLVKVNPVPPVAKRYVRIYKSQLPPATRKLISVEAAADMVQAIHSPRDLAVVVLLLKTGMRVGEFCRLDVADVDIEGLTLALRPAAKRSNRTLFFDRETADCLQAWLDVRDSRLGKPLFTTKFGRMCISTVEDIVKMHAERVGIHEPGSMSLENRFTPHCCRHWHATHLLRAGMRREYVQWLRGDALREAVDTYYHIDSEDVKQAYLAHIPQLGT